MIDRIKKYLRENKARQIEIIAQNEELIWSSIFHDSIRGKKGIEDLSLNIGRWAGNYSFFYVLNRILNDYEPKRIIEFGLGESSKFVSTYLENYLLQSEHLIIEQNADWKKAFESRFQLSARSSINVLPLVKKLHKDFEYNGYEDIENQVQTKFDLYIIDGPFGSKNFSRFDIFTLAKKLDKNDEFIILIDDFQRSGEKETTLELINMFKEKGIDIYMSSYNGIKSVKVIGTKKYMFVKSL